MPRKVGQAGFTLVEVLIVMAIVALLSGLAAPKVYAAVQQARMARAQDELQTISAALDRHFLDHGHYPVKLNELIETGYIKPGTKFASPVNRLRYFYAVDDNHDGKSQHYALGQPGKTLGINAPQWLRHGGLLPAGRDPNWAAWAWYAYSSGGLFLLDDADAAPMPNAQIPRSLDSYRTSCRPGSPDPCDLITT